MEPYKIQRALCIDLRDNLYGLKTDKPLYILPWNHHVAAGEGYPGWVWLSPHPDKACHHYGKYVVRLDEENLSIGYAVERGYPPAVAEPLGVKSLDHSWSWSKVLAGARDGTLVNAAQQAQKASAQLIVYAAVGNMSEKRTRDYAAMLNAAGKLIPGPVLPGVKNSAEDLKSCVDLPSIAERLEAVTATEYVDFQLLVTFDLKRQAENLWHPSQFSERLLRHFEPWVPFRPGGLNP